MKNLVLSLALVMLSLQGISQGIEFFDGKYEDALIKAKEENKPLFIDFYTSWCGPCKLLKKNIFPQKSVGDFFNKSFVCFKLQVDKKGTNHEEIAKKFNITVYPTLMWIDKEEKLLHLSLGYKEADALIKEAKLVFDENKRVGTCIEKWNNGDRSFNVGIKYFAFNRNSKGEFEDYFEGLSQEEKLDESFLTILTVINWKKDGKVFDFLVKHRDHYKKICSSDLVENTIDYNIKSELKEKYSTDAFDEVVNKYRSLGLKEIDFLVKQIEYRDFLDKKDFTSFLNSAKEFINLYALKNPTLYEDLVFDLYGVDRGSFPKNANFNIAIKWANDFKEISSNEADFGLIKFVAYVVAEKPIEAKKIGDEYLATYLNSSSSKIKRDRGFVEFILGKLK
ncbi:thioredoxin fold domain-containing protein [Ancylomarina sp. 16SWW S1-10-2]|uniref:thioredoxin family protein n=1 Tax=Ancylomarina sp. 16SWW S1-10-2 TaxID=2499681 RepID=UPI0012AE8B12|nr:thioredoxin fold domain-containing protein [Ancylomarina sp. 16SWW S1-10-2]MRT94724.1 DUF255 domain-containing protein [Ancylomarina sp. 16SWW S1-10-2]